MYSVCYNYFLFYLFKCWQLLLAWLGHHEANIYKKIENAVAYDITRQYWPNDGLVRPKVVANIWKDKIKKNSCDGVNILFNFNIVL